MGEQLQLFLGNAAPNLPLTPPERQRSLGSVPAGHWVRNGKNAHRAKLQYRQDPSTARQTETWFAFHASRSLLTQCSSRPLDLPPISRQPMK